MAEQAKDTYKPDFSIYVSLQEIDSFPEDGGMCAVMNGEAFINIMKGKTVDTQNKKRRDEYIPFQVKSVSYHKKMYQPCELEVEGFVLYDKVTGNNGALVNENPSTLIDYYRKKFIKSTLSIYEDKQDKDSHDYLDSTKNYIIHSLSVRQDPTSSSGLYITLKACSMDKKLDLQPYCETYYNKALVDDILKGSLEKNSTDKDGKTINVGGIFQSSGVVYDNTTTYTNMGDKYQDTAKNEKNEDVLIESPFDYKQPYLVQYNETFYHFLARTANRCGEYMYFEDGKLVVGNRTSNTICLGDLSNAVIDFPEENTCDKDDTAFGELGINPVNVHNGYTDHFKDGKHVELVESGMRGYNDEVYDDSNNYSIQESDNYTGEKDVISDGIATTSAFGSIFQAEGLGDMFTVAALKLNELGLRDQITKQLKEDFNNKNNSKAMHNATLNTHDKPMPFCSEWYAKILKGQRDQDGKRMVVRLCQHPNSMLLGNNISMADSKTSKEYENAEKYVIDEVYGKWLIKTTVTQDGDSESTDTIIINEHYITAIKEGVAPYLGMENRIRKSSAQMAIVADNKDPLRMGRIRVRYPWDLASNYSPWIRVCTPAAYDGGGIICTPAEEDEVMVDYENGNMEKPYVVGFVHTKDHRPYLGAKTWWKKAGAYKIENDPNSFCLTNRTGQSITLANGKGSTAFIAGMMPGAVGSLVKGLEGGKNGDSHLSGNITLTDAYGITTIKQDTGNRCITIDSALGQIKMSAFDGISISAPNGDIKIKGKNISLEAGNNINIKSGGNKEWLGWGAAGNAAGKAIVDIAVGIADTWALWGIGTTVIKGALDVSFIRAAFELIIRPIQGTTTIKSDGNIELVTHDNKPEKDDEQQVNWWWNRKIKDLDDVSKENDYTSKDERFFNGAGAGMLNAAINALGLNSFREIAEDIKREFDTNADSFIKGSIISSDAYLNGGTIDAQPRNEI